MEYKMRRNFTHFIIGTAILSGLFSTGCEDRKAAKSSSENIVELPLNKIGIPPAFPLNKFQQEHLAEVVRAWRFPYDSTMRLLLLPKPSPSVHNNYATNPMHSLRLSLEYAVACMDSGNEEYRKRALDILDVVISHQDINPESKTFGIWSDYIEIPLDKMRSPDFNSADFISISLMEIRFVHADRLPESMKQKIDSAIQHAARSIVRRNVPASYTNVAMMSSCLTLIAGEAYGLPDVKTFGMNKLEEIKNYKNKEEYNSPNYTTVALNALLRMKNYIRDPEAMKIIEELYYNTWRDVALRYHSPTQQWSGPHSRCYQDVLPDGVRAMIESGVTDKVVSIKDLSKAEAASEFRLLHSIPPRLRPYFTTLEESRNEVEVFSEARDGMPPVIGTTWLTPQLSLGSISRGDMWDQRRNLQAYWGSAKNPAYLRTRFLKDNYDFAAVNFFSVQEKQRVLAALNFSTNGGDKHLFMDAIKGGRFAASSLRLRFEFGGAAKDSLITLPANSRLPVRIEAAGVKIFIQSPFAKFDGVPGYWQTGRNSKCAWLDLVLYQGKKTNFSLRDVKESAVGFALQIMSKAESESSEPVSLARFEANRLFLQWNDLDLSISCLPDLKAQLQAKVDSRPKS